MRSRRIILDLPCWCIISKTRRKNLTLLQSLSTFYMHCHYHSKVSNAVSSRLYEPYVWPGVGRGAMSWGSCIDTPTPQKGLSSQSFPTHHIQSNLILIIMFLLHAQPGLVCLAKSCAMIRTQRPPLPIDKLKFIFSKNIFFRFFLLIFLSCSWRKA